MGHPTSVVVLGGGPGGYEAALVAARLGASVTVVDRDGLGGACVLTDCVPSKTLISTAGFVTNRASGDDLGVGLADATVDLAAANARILDLAEAQSHDIAARLTGDGVRIVRGTGTLLGAGAVRATGLDGTAEDLDAEVVLRGDRVDAAHHADRAAGRRADPHLAADLLADRAARAPRRRRVRRDRRRARPRVRRSRRPGHPGLVARPGPARRGRRRGDGHRGGVPARRHAGPRTVADGERRADGRRGMRDAHRRAHRARLARAPRRGLGAADGGSRLGGERDRAYRVRSHRGGRRLPDLGPRRVCGGGLHGRPAPRLGRGDAGPDRHVARAGRRGRAAAPGRRQRQRLHLTGDRHGGDHPERRRRRAGGRAGGHAAPGHERAREDGPLHATGSSRCSPSRRAGWCSVVSSWRRGPRS